jgi:3-methyladenine DNA glycosylase/8-oxoguanine DNA glycosylase
MADGWWRAARTPLGSVTLHLRRSLQGIEATAWGSGSQWMLERVPALVGMDDRPDGLVTDHPLVSDLLRRHRGVRFGATGLVFEALVHAVVAQKVTGKEAARGMRNISRQFGEPAPGPRPLTLPVDPDRLAAVPYWELHTAGIERKRADTLRRLAADAGRIERLAASAPDDARRALHRYRGVGVWTSAETVAVSHGDADAVSVGDYHHKNLVAWHLTGRPRGTDEEMLELLEPFRPHRGRVVRLLEGEGHAPSFGPRMPLRSFEDR